MRLIVYVIAFFGLILTIVPSVLVFYGRMSMNMNTQLLFIGMILWFVFAPFVMKKKNA